MKKNRWEIIYEDDHIIIVDKPANYLSIPDRYDPNIPNLYHSLLNYRESIFVNHRLDKDTSGLMLFSKSEKAHKAISVLFESNQINKHYKALVHGTPIEEVGLIDLSLAASKSVRKGMQVNSNGKKAIDKIESEIKDIQNKLIDIDFYNSPDGTEAMKNLGKLEADLELKNEEWDEMVSGMDQ